LSFNEIKVNDNAKPGQIKDFYPLMAKFSLKRCLFAKNIFQIFISLCPIVILLLSKLSISWYTKKVSF